MGIAVHVLMGSIRQEFHLTSERIGLNADYLRLRDAETEQKTNYYMILQWGLIEYLTLRPLKTVHYISLRLGVLSLKKRALQLEAFERPAG